MSSPAHAHPPQPKNGDGDHRDDLWQLYRIAFDDRNFQVSLNWDRTKHFFIFNVGLFTVAAAVQGLGKTSVGVERMVLGLLALATLNSAFAAYSIRRGHEYYRESRRFLTMVGRELGIVGADLEHSRLSMHTTRGMAREITGAPPRWADKVTITALSIALQLAIAAGSAIAFVGLLMS